MSIDASLEGRFIAFLHQLLKRVPNGPLAGRDSLTVRRLLHRVQSLSVQLLKALGHLMQHATVGIGKASSAAPGARPKGGRRNAIVVSHTDAFLPSTTLARRTLARKCSAFAVQVNEHGFCLPSAKKSGASVELKASELAMLLEGIDLTSIKRRKRFALPMKKVQ